MSTKSAILNLLQRDALTIVELCERLDITRNAVNVQLRQLESEGLVRRGKVERHGTIGKPAIRYEAAPGSEDIASGAYQVFLPKLLEVMQARLSASVLAELLDETGRRVAREAGLANPVDFESGLRGAMAAADALGASTEAVDQPDGVLVRNYSCPLGGAVRDQPCVCQALASFFSEATGYPATEQCSRDGRLICQYAIQVSRKQRKRV
jgi:predicted ArsR family transcriptional regulator